MPLTPESDRPGCSPGMELYITNPSNANFFPAGRALTVWPGRVMMGRNQVAATDGATDGACNDSRRPIACRCNPDSAHGGRSVNGCNSRNERGLTMTTDERIEKLEKGLAKLREDLLAISQRWVNVLTQQSIPPEPSPGEKILGRTDEWTFTRPVAYSFLGQRHHVSAFKDILLGVCHTLADKHGADFAEVLGLRGFDRDPGNLGRASNPRKIAGSGIYVATTLSANAVRDRCYEVLCQLKYPASELRVHVRNFPNR